MPHVLSYHLRTDLRMLISRFDVLSGSVRGAHENISRLFSV